MVRTKVFIGNLSFKTREAELAQQFETVAKVVSVNIITRGPRSLGYGFVELESEEDAKKAVAAMDKKDIDGRPINVDLAKTRPEGEDNKPATGADGSSPKPNAARRAPRQRRAPNAEANGAQTASPNANAGEGASPAAQRPRRPRQPRQPKAEGEAAASPSANADGSSPTAARPRRQRKPRAPKAEGESAAAPAEQKPRAPRQPRAPREPTDNSNRVPSETSLFVANLPFSLTNESFAQLLNEVTLKFKKAHVVTKRNQKSKGFGFVEFDNQEDQKKALDTLTGKKIEDREIVPKVALVDPKKPADPNTAVPQSPAATPAAEAKTN